MEAKRLISEMAAKARAASFTLVAASANERRDYLIKISDQLSKSKAQILTANQIDLNAAQAAGISESMLDRLRLTEKRIDEMAAGVKSIANLTDPLGEVLAERTLENGLLLRQMRVPFGVVGMIYEARPNVTVDAGAILIKSGNAALLRGSTTAAHSNQVLVEIMRSCAQGLNISPDVIQLIPSENRETTTALLTARGEVDLVIPRGSAQLIQMVVDEATVPTIETGAGVCHVYIDKSADQAMAIEIAINSKTHRPSVCNAAETILVHKDIAKEFLPNLLGAMINAGVVINADSQTQVIADSSGQKVKAATDKSWSTEYGSLEINIGVVDDVLAAISHISRYGTNHTEAIVAKDAAAINLFTKLNDSAAIMINASTRFTDGEQMGFGAEIGISNQKLHARGPMGIAEMTTSTWIVTGNGQVRS